jgi:hypothetical protein
MQSSQIPSRLWDYGLVYIVKIQLLLPCGLDQRPGIERVTENVVNISEWLNFDVLTGYGTGTKRKGISHGVGCDMTYWILTSESSNLSLALPSNILPSPTWQRMT